jgi:hypothetical protein
MKKPRRRELQMSPAREPNAATRKDWSCRNPDTFAEMVEPTVGHMKPLNTNDIARTAIMRTALELIDTTNIVVQTANASTPNSNIAGAWSAKGPPSNKPIVSEAAPSVFASEVVAGLQPRVGSCSKAASNAPKQ